jgi:malonyl-CoA/methylmalonyl-CoA synthetase
MPGVAESAVVGVPHPDFGEAVVAVVVPQAGRRARRGGAMIGALKARIANFKVPKQVFVVTELPRNTMGKVQKNLLRDQHSGRPRCRRAGRPERAVRVRPLIACLVAV